MELRKVINRTNVQIKWDINTSKTRTIVFPIKYQPDQLTIKQICYSGAAAAIATPRFVFANKLATEIFAINDQAYGSPQIVFNVREIDFKSEWVFSLVDVSGAIDAAYTGVLSFMVELVEFQKK